MNADEIAFGPFQLSIVRRTLQREGRPVRLGNRAFDVLCALASAHGDTVTKDELIARVWPNQIVEDNALQVQVSALRRALGETTEGQSYILTVPGRGYRFLGFRPHAPEDIDHSSARTTSSPPRGSVVVLPFRNMSSDLEQEYFVDGVVEDIITGLSRIKWLSVIARNSSFIYKGRTVDARQVARELGVRYVLEGSVRKAGNRIRVTVELIDAETGAPLWIERYDRLLCDIFALQDELTMSVVGAIEPTLRRAEIERVRRKRPENLDAYDLVLRAMPHVHSHLAAEASDAIPLLRRALELEPDYPGAHAALALCHHSRFSRAGLHEEDRANAVFHARAASVDVGDDATALGIAGFVISLIEHDHATARKLFDRALALSPCDIFTLWCSAIALSWMGETKVSIERAERALQLSPFDPLNYLAYNALAISHFQTGRYQEAYDSARRSVLLSPRFSVSQSFLVASLMGLGRDQDARMAAQRLLALDPNFSVRRFAVTVDIKPEVFAAFAGAWRAAGVPEG
ncbi:MAG: hypothetical protein ABS54_15870 [Hyphomicrobium sp. SCN 65-11]|nr:MAG: hypothetical protein ABS54_15870 [Hyphomicrobium sp. SCN 65-11]